MNSFSSVAEGIFFQNGVPIKIITRSYVMDDPSNLEQSNSSVRVQRSGLQRKPKERFYERPALINYRINRVTCFIM